MDKFEDAVDALAKHAIALAKDQMKEGGNLRPTPGDLAEEAFYQFDQEVSSAIYEAIRGEANKEGYL